MHYQLSTRWLDILLLDFYNNWIHDSAQQSLFYANCRRYPKFDLFIVSKFDNLVADKLVTRLFQMHEIVKLQLQEIQNRLKNVCRWDKEGASSTIDW